LSSLSKPQAFTIALSLGAQVRLAPAMTRPVITRKPVSRSPTCRHNQSPYMAQFVDKEIKDERAFARVREGPFLL
jgi:hypothetical protein